MWLCEVIPVNSVMVSSDRWLNREVRMYVRAYVCVLD